MSHRSILFIVATVLSSTAACEAGDTPDEAIDSRHGTYSIRSVKDGPTLESEIWSAGELVAVASLDDEEARVTLVASGMEVVSVPPDDLEDVDAYQASLADVSTALELQATEEAFRSASACGYASFRGGLGQLCIASWCSGTSCNAIDCAPAADGCGELHYIAPECSIT